MDWKGGSWVLGLFLLLTCGCSREETMPLRDGRTVRIWTVTYGTNHIAPGQSMQILDKRLPSVLQRVLRFCYPAAAAQVQISTSPRPSLVMWTRPVEAPTNSGTRASLRLLHPGNTTSEGFWVDMQGVNTPPGLPAVDSVVLERFPRRAKVIPLEVQEPVVGSRDWPTSSAVVHLRNPQPYSGPSWSPDSLPITRSKSGIEATLFDLTVTNWALTNSPAPGRMIQRTYLKFEASGSDGKPLRVLGYELSDPGGNLLHVPIGRVLDRTAAHPFQAALFPDEPAWRLVVETDMPGSDAETTLDRIEFKNFVDPSEGGRMVTTPPPRQLSTRVPQLGITLFYRSLGNSPNVEVNVEGRPPGVRVELERVHDELGREWNAKPMTFGGAYAPTDFNEYHLSLPNPPNAPPKSLNLTFRIFRTAVFEFHPPARFQSTRH